jgi:hypothetical protein
MNGVTNEQQPGSWLPAIWAARYRTPARFVALIALLLPWTTTGLTFALRPWLIALAFIDLRAFPRSLLRPVCLLPIALVVLVAFGTLWSDAPWPERIHALACWIGMLVVVQNMLSSLLNTPLFDFTSGWIYVLGVGVAGGMALNGERGGAASTTDGLDCARLRQTPGGTPK